MYQIDNASAAASRPAASSAGTPGWFTDGNPGTSTPATIFPAEFANMLMAEILNVLTAAGVTADKTNSAQLLAALRAAGVFQTQATNDSTTKVATTAFANPGSSQSTSGYQKLPSGLIIQWGQVTNSATPQTNTAVTFPIAFTSACYSITTGDPFSNNANTIFAGTYTTTTFQMASTLASSSASWIAIGK